jgi:hypothetical protein
MLDLLEVPGSASALIYAAFGSKVASRIERSSRCCPSFQQMLLGDSGAGMTTGQSHSYPEALVNV